MTRIAFSMMMAALLVLGAAGCSDDSVSPKKDPPPDPAYQDLSEEWHVLHNLEKAYNEMNVTAFQELLETGNFTFYFNPGDVGGDIPAQWGPVEEIRCAQNMFTAEGGSDNNPVVSIEVMLSYDNGSWDDYQSEDFPNETLRRIRNVVYDFIIVTANDITYITSNAPRMDVTVRNVDGHWKLVEWFDRGDGSALLSPAASQANTWSTVKSLYQ